MKKLRYLYIFCGVFLFYGASLGQSKVDYIFKDRRIVNSYSTETISKNMLDFRIGHRFGDFSGDAGNWQTFYGLESAADVMIGFEYGITDNINIGINRTKGAGELKQLINLHGKWKFGFSEGPRPAAVALIGTISASTMNKIDAPDVINSFPEFQHRLIYHAEILASKKFSEFISGQVKLSYIHRNFVVSEDKNDLFLVGAATRIRISPAFCILADITLPISIERNNGEIEYYFPLGFGLEWETKGGHVFQFNIVNNRGLIETDYMPYSTSNWGAGQFRLGFTISRLFRL